jgi:hypothetical protein
VHVVHLEDPEIGAYVPVSHLVHTEEPTVEL